MVLQKVEYTDAEILWKMQVAAFSELLDRYHDYATSPANESLDRILIRLAQPSTYYYLLLTTEKKSAQYVSRT